MNIIKLTNNLKTNLTNKESFTGQKHCSAYFILVIFDVK